MSQLAANGRIILSVDTSRAEDAQRLVKVAKDAGARFVKFGLGQQAAESWAFCSRLAGQYGLEWVADAKLSDIPVTVSEAVKNIKNLAYPPFGITMHTTAGIAAMQAAQAAAGPIKMFGVTVLTSMSDAEALRIFHVPVRQKVMELAQDAAAAGLAGIVCSPLEVGMIKDHPDTKHLFAMIPGTRSAGAGHGDQSRVASPVAALHDGADLLVIGRQITQANDPEAAYQALITEIEGAQ